MFLLRFMPYQIFFALGFTYTFIGLLLWPLWSFGFIQYPLLLHRHLLIWGGLGSFATGFILTSIPCFTGTKTTTTREYFLVLLVHFLFLILTLFSSLLPFLMPVASLILSLTLGSFFYQRVKTAKYNVPRAFHLIGLAFIFGALGSLAGFLRQVHTSDLWFRLEKALSFQLVFLTLLLGVGSRLFTGIFGLNLNKQEEFRGLVAFALVIVFQVLAVLFPDWRLVLSGCRAICLLIALNAFWKFPLFPKAKSWESRWSWFFWMSVALGAFAEPFFPAQFSSAQHILFIGGFLGLCLVIASRIIMAHGGYLLGHPEPLFKQLGICFSLLFLSLVFRELTLLPSTSLWSIPLAGFTGLVAVSLWGWIMLPKIFKRNELILRKGP